MLGTITKEGYKVSSHKAGAALAFGELCSLNTAGAVVVTSANTKSVYGVVARTIHDQGESIASGDTVTVLTEGEIEIKKNSGVTVESVPRYNFSSKELVTTGGSYVHGMTIVGVRDTTTAVVRVSNAITFVQS